MRYTTTKNVLSVALALLALAFAGPGSAQRAGQSVTQQIGTVIGKQAVDLESAAGGGALVGGTLGAVTTSSRASSSRRARNAIIGGAAGAAIASRSQGNRNGMQYTVEVGPGTRITVVTDQTEIRVGDCVIVEQGGTGLANVRRASPSLCEASVEDEIDNEIREELNELANMCLRAKERLLDAETDEEIEAAIRRVNILCDD